MFDAAAFSLPSETQLLKFNLSAELPEIRFGLFSSDPAVKAKDIKTIAFGVCVDGKKHRHGSVVINDDYILVLSMDNQHEYRANDMWHCISFLKKLLGNNFDWDKTL